MTAQPQIQIPAALPASRASQLTYKKRSLSANSTIKAYNSSRSSTTRTMPSTKFVAEKIEKTLMADAAEDQDVLDDQILDKIVHVHQTKDKKGARVKKKSKPKSKPKPSAKLAFTVFKDASSSNSNSTSDPDRVRRPQNVPSVVKLVPAQGSEKQQSAAYIIRNPLSVQPSNTTLQKDRRPSIDMAQASRQQQSQSLHSSSSARKHGKLTSIGNYKSQKEQESQSLHSSSSARKLGELSSIGSIKSQRNQAYVHPPRKLSVLKLKNPNLSSPVDFPITAESVPAVDIDSWASVEGRWSRPSRTSIGKISGKETSSPSSPDPIAFYRPDKHVKVSRLAQVRSIFSVETPKTSDPLLVTDEESEDDIE